MSYGKIYGSFWTDKKIRSYSDDGRLLAAYLLSSPHRNLIGCCRLPMGYICDDLQWNGDRVSFALTELAAGDRPFIVRDQDGWTHIVNSLKFDRIAGVNHFLSAVKFLEQIPKDSPVFGSVAPKLAAIWNGGVVPFPVTLTRYLKRDLLSPPQAPPEDLATPAPAPEPFPAPEPAPEPEPKTNMHDDFKAWYLQYPRKVGRGQAERAFKTALAKTDIRTLIDGAIRYRNDPNRKDEFTKYPATWLNGECWLDEPLPERANGKANGNGKLSPHGATGFAGLRAQAREDHRRRSEAETSD